MSPISLKSSISQLFKTASHIFIEMSSEILEHFKHFPFPATNCFFKQLLMRSLINTLGAPFYGLVKRDSLISLTDRAAQSNCSETCYIPLKSWELQLFRHVSLIFIEMSSENPEDFEQFYFPATNCFSNKQWCAINYCTLGTPLHDSSIKVL